MKYLAMIREQFANTPVFSVRDLLVFLQKKGISRKYARLLLHNLEKKGEIERINKGIYSFKKDLMVAGFAFSPFYYGLQEALSLRNLWEQETNPIIITTKKARPGTRQIMESNILVRRISKKMFFGYEMQKYYDYWIPVSDMEKTLIDFAYFKEQLDKIALQEIKQKIDKKKLEEYLKLCPKQTRKKVEKLLSQKPPLAKY
jgi:predicted transcriptional regulator of viral defense system